MLPLPPPLPPCAQLQGEIRDPYRVYCTRCPMGKQKRPTADGSAHACVSCAASMFAPAGSANCSVCDGAAFPDATRGSCIRCAAGSYRAFDDTCSTCPLVGVECAGGALAIRNGFWRPTAPNASALALQVTLQTTFYRCANDVACLAPAPGELTVACARDFGYFGALCGGCDFESGFIRSGSQCSKCEAEAVNWIALVAILHVILAFVIYIAVFRSTTRRGDESGGIIRRIAFSYIQMLGILGIFKARGTKFFNDVIGKSSEVAGGSLTSTVLIKCLLASQAYAPFVLNMMLPVLSAVLIGIIMVITTIVKRRVEASRRAREVIMRKSRERAAAQQAPALEHQPTVDASKILHIIFLPPRHEPIVDVGSLCGRVPTNLAIKIACCRKPASKE